MSWSQDYQVPCLNNLLLDLVGKDLHEILTDQLNEKGLKIIKTEEFLLTDDMYGDVIGERVFLSDGRIFEPKLIRREIADGNWGRDVYEYRLQDEQVKVEDVDLSHAEEVGCCDGCEQGYGCEFPDEGC